MAIRSLRERGVGAGAPAKRNGGRAMVDTDAAYKEAVCQLFDTISDEIEVGRACQQLATNLADTLAMARQGEPCRIDVLDVLPLQVILPRHVKALEEIFEAFNVL